MSLSQVVAVRAANLVCGILGRHQTVRAARFLLNRARLDFPNEATSNGEHDLQRWLLSLIPSTEAVTALDVGANVGEWSRALVRHAHQSGHADRLVIHAFEPASYTHALLANRLPNCVRKNRLVVSDRIGEATFHIRGPGLGTNSLYSSSVTGDATANSEIVKMTTIDTYIEQNNIHHIDLLKIDTEGHDFSVMVGAAEAFHARAISVVQFEYNHRWVHARHFLKDVFDFLQPFGYRVGKLTPRGMEPYPAWDPDLETFIEGNYLACTQEMADKIPRIEWWKRTS